MQTRSMLLGALSPGTLSYLSWIPVFNWTGILQHCHWDLWRQILLLCTLTFWVADSNLKQWPYNFFNNPFWKCINALFFSFSEIISSLHLVSVKNDKKNHQPSAPSSKGNGDNGPVISINMIYIYIYIQQLN